MKKIIQDKKEVQLTCHKCWCVFITDEYKHQPSVQRTPLSTPTQPCMSDTCPKCGVAVKFIW